MPQRRKAGSSLSPVAGGRKRGVVATDPAGRQQILPFSAGSIQVLTGDGVFADPTVAWGSITGTLSDQTDLQHALDLKQDLLQFDAVLGAYVVPF